MDRTIISLFLSGLILGSGPCLATCGPVLISYIIATKQKPRQALFIWLLFSLSRIFIYLILGVGIFLLGDFLVKQNLLFISNYIYIIGGVIIILVGIFSIFGVSSGQNRICSRISSWLGSRLSGIQPIIMGLILGMLPCMPLLAALSYIGLISRTWQWSMFYSFIFGIGTLISPLILLSLGAGVMPKILLHNPKVHNILRIISGLFIILFGVLLIFQASNASIILP